MKHLVFTFAILIISSYASIFSDGTSHLRTRNLESLVEHHLLRRGRGGPGPKRPLSPPPKSRSASPLLIYNPRLPSSPLADPAMSSGGGISPSNLRNTKSPQPAKEKSPTAPEPWRMPAPGSPNSAPGQAAKESPRTSRQNQSLNTRPARSAFSETARSKSPAADAVGTPSQGQHSQPENRDRSRSPGLLPPVRFSSEELSQLQNIVASRPAETQERVYQPSANRLEENRALPGMRPADEARALAYLGHGGYEFSRSSGSEMSGSSAAPLSSSPSRASSEGPSSRSPSPAPA